jgi:hypothetical protein
MTDRLTHVPYSGKPRSVRATEPQFDLTRFWIGVVIIVTVTVAIAGLIFVYWR